MTTPSIVPTGYAGDSSDYLKAKVDRSGAVRVISGSVAIPASTATDTIIGLAPFEAGMKLGYGSRVYVTDLDSSTNVTLDLGYVFSDNSTYTNVLDAFVAASTAPQAGGMIEMTNSAGMTFSAGGNGWITAQVNAATTTTGTIVFNLAVAYDISGVTNSST